MERYRYLLFDADHTLLDYGADEISAWQILLAQLGLPTDEETVSFCHQASERVWTKAGLYAVNDPKIQKAYHSLYRSHLTGLFKEIFAKYPCQADPSRLGQRFIELLALGRNLRDNAEEVLRKLSKKSGGRYEIAIVTNGLSEMQRARLKGLEKYTNGIFVSEELGVIKPQAEFFEKVLRSINATAEECLMIGDSFTSDISGANSVGIDGCWLRSRDRVEETPFSPTYTIRSLTELLNIL